MLRPSAIAMPSRLIINKKRFEVEAKRLMDIIVEDSASHKRELDELTCLFKGIILVYRKNKISINRLAKRYLDFVKSLDGVGLESTQNLGSLLIISKDEKSFIEENVFPRILTRDPFAVSFEYKEHFGRLELAGLRKNSIPIPDID